MVDKQISTLRMKYLMYAMSFSIFSNSEILMCPTDPRWFWVDLLVEFGKCPGMVVIGLQLSQCQEKLAYVQTFRNRFPPFDIFGSQERSSRV